MKITLHKKAPECPNCEVPMKFENNVYSDEQEKKMNCKHKWTEYKQIEELVQEKECVFCGEKQREILHRSSGYWEPMTYMPIPSIPTYQCPKCFNIYKVEE